MERSLCYTRFSMRKRPPSPPCFRSQCGGRFLHRRGVSAARIRHPCPAAADHAAGGRERLSPDTLRAMDAYSPSRAVAKLK